AALGDDEATVVQARGGVAVVGQPAQLGHGQAQRLGQLLRRVERRQLVLGGALLGVGEVPLVGAGGVLPEDAVAEVDDVVGLVGAPGFPAQLAALLGLG